MVEYVKIILTCSLITMQNLVIIMHTSSLGGGRILRRTLSVRLSVCPSVGRSVPLWNVTWRHLANYNDTHRRYRYRASRRAT